MVGQQDEPIPVTHELFTATKVMDKRQLYHGANGDKILTILNTGKMIPDSSNELFFDEQNFANCFMHGGDKKRGASFVLKVEIDLNGVQYRRDSRPGNPSTLIVTTFAPFPATVLEMYVRKRDEDGNFEILPPIKGAAAIKSYLQGT